MSIARCCDCGAPFARDADEAWKVRCLSCWVRRRNRPQGPPPRTAGAAVRVDPIRRELGRAVRGLLSLCHPDKHNGSQLSTTVTQWLLEARDRLERHTRERVS